jgi:hypothetical protein
MPSPPSRTEAEQMRSPALDLARARLSLGLYRLGAHLGRGEFEAAVLALADCLAAPLGLTEEVASTIASDNLWAGLRYSHLLARIEPRNPEPAHERR